MRLTGLTCPDGFVSPQYVAGAVDTTGMNFIAEYDDGSHASVSPQSHSPTTWGNTAGEKTCTFSYTENEVTVTCEVDANVEWRGAIDTFSYTGTPTNTQTQWEPADLTGLTFTFNVSPGNDTIEKTWTEIAEWNTAHPADPLLYIVSSGNYDGVYKRAGNNVNLTVRTGSGWTLLGYLGNPQGIVVPVNNVVPTLTGISISGSWTDDSQTLNAERDYTGLTFTKSYSNHGDVTMTEALNRDLHVGGEIIEMSPGNFQRRQGEGWITQYSNEAPTFWFREVDNVKYTKQGTETVNVAVAPAITVTLDSSSLVKVKSLTIDPTIEGWVGDQFEDLNDILIPNVFNGLSNYEDEDFFIDLAQQAPITVSEGDVFWYVMMKDDYDNDELLSVPAQGLGPMIVGLGLNPEDPELIGGLSSNWGGMIQTGVMFDANLTGEGTWTNEKFVCVTAWAPAGATDVNVATLKPSDLTEIGRFEITVRDLSVVVLDSITVTGSEGAAQPNDEQPDFTGYTFTFGLSNGESVVKTGAEITANNADGPTYFINYGGTAFHSGSDHPLWDWNNPQETVNITLGDYWTSEGYLIDDPAPSTSITMGTHYATTLSYSGSLTNPQYILNVNHTLGEPDSPAEPDLTGLSFTVGFADGTSEAVSTSDCQVSPYEYEAGNPSNLTSQPLTITYAGSEVGTPSVAITNNITHRPDGQTLDSANAGYVYHDFPAELWNLIKTEGSTFSGMGSVYQGQVNEGSWLCLWLTDDAYQNDTAIDYTTFGQWASHYGIVLQSSGTVNTPGFNPGWASRLDGNDLSACYISECVDGSSQISTFETCHVLVGKATKNISGSVKKSDLDYTNGVHYTIHVGPVDYS